MIVTTRLGAGGDGRGRRQACSHAGRSAAADGEIVWSWRRDPGATSVGIRSAGNGGKKGRFPREITYKP